MRTFRILCLVMLCGGSATPMLAANPQLLAYEQGIDDPESESEALRLADLALDFDVVGALADVTLTARFANPSDETLEGLFSFELPEDAVVTGYALDIDGLLMDGVLVDQLKAQRAYQAKVREGIDPGLANVSRANVFSTRVYPIPEEGERTIQLKFSAPIHAVRGLGFALQTDDPVGQFHFTLSSTALAKLPIITLPNDLQVSWQDLRYSDRAVAGLFGKPLSGELRIAPVQPQDSSLLSIHANGERRVHIVDTSTRVEKARDTGRRLRVYWDRSLSRRAQKLPEERQLLAKFIARAKPQSIDLVLFNSSGATVQRVTAAQMDSALAGVTYRGATSFAVLDELAAPPADQCLVFTDGVVTIDAREEFQPGCEVFAITSAADADRGYLQRLAGGNGSAVLQLGVQGGDEILARLRGAGPRVVRVVDERGESLSFAALDGGGSGWSVITEAPATGAVVLMVAGVRGHLVERRYAPVLARRPAFDAAGALWAANGIAELAADDVAHDAFVALSRKFSVASPQMAFIVLEQAQDYVNADIEPAAGIPKEMLAEYRELRTGRDREMRDAREQRLGNVLEQWQEVVDWWQTRFDPRALKPEPKKQALPARAQTSAETPVRRAAAPAVDSQEMAEFGGELDEVMVTGARAGTNLSVNAMHSADVDAARSIEVEMAAWSLTRPYLVALDAAAPADVDRIFAAQEREFGTLPVFYFDVAEWLRRHGREGDAEEMLLSALELPVADEETSAMVAERLQRYGSMDRAVWLLERAAAQVDYLPQPRRALALALARRAAMPGGSQARADLERAVALLNEVIMTPWDSEYDGIEVVSLMEVNALLPRARALGLRKLPLDDRLRALLDVDLRVVIEWNTAATDMDLWVDEPNGERAIYSNPRTAIGGRLSNDMTQGFGPEEYLLRRSATGEYSISVHVYDADEINPNGSTVITARLFRDYGRPNQSEQTMEIELEPGEAGERLIGKFTVR